MTTTRTDYAVDASACVGADDTGSLDDMNPAISAVSDIDIAALSTATPFGPLDSQ